MKNIMKVTTLQTKDGLASLEASLRLLTKRQVLVGVPADKDYRSPTSDDQPINNAELAFIHDKGSPAQNIPARPFMEPGIEEGMVPIKDAMKKTANAALEGRPEDVDKGFIAVGLVAQAAIRNKLVEGPFQALAPSTLAARRRRGFVGTSPLNVTGQLRNAISAVIRNK